MQPADYRVTVYIKVGAGWWTKPYANSPLTVIQPDGSWTCDITTGGIDQTATEIAAFVVPAAFQPPVLLGSGTLPAALDQNAVAKRSIPRALPCTFAITPASQAFLAGADTGTVNVATANSCNWTAASNDSWITITSGSAGAGSGTVRYSVTTNPGPGSRKGTLTIAEQPFTVTQADEGVPCSAQALIQYGDTITCSVTIASATTTFRFVANVADVVVIQASRRDGTNFYPCIELIRPDNTRASACRLDYASRLEQVLNQSGTYTILVTAGFTPATGNYVLSLERVLPPSPTARRLDYGTTIAGEINPGGDLDLFSFQGAAGENIAISVTSTGGQDFYPCIELIQPDNTRASGCGLVLANRVDRLLTQTGTHSILVSSHYAFATGNYVLSLHRLQPPSASAQRIQYGSNVRGEIDPPGDFDLFFFEGQARDTVALMASSLGGLYFEPCLELIAPDGTRSGSCSLNLSHRVDRVLPQSGVYSVLVFDQASAVAGGKYSLSLQCLAGPCAQAAVN